MPTEKCGNIEIISHSATTFRTIIFSPDFTHIARHKSRDAPVARLYHTPPQFVIVITVIAWGIRRDVPMARLYLQRKAK